MHNRSTDVWTYISFGYFAQVGDQGTTGSSTMPHKVNPIRFENAEANLEVSAPCSTCSVSTLVNQPPAARPHRLRRCSATSAPAFGHSLLAIDNVARGLAGLEADPPRRWGADLDATWEVLGEAVQSAMRAARGGRRVTGTQEPVRAAQGAGRAAVVWTGPAIREFVAGLGLPPEVEHRLSELTPARVHGRCAESWSTTWATAPEPDRWPVRAGRVPATSGSWPWPCPRRRRRSRGVTDRRTRSVGSRSSSIATPVPTHWTRTVTD